MNSSDKSEFDVLTRTGRAIPKSHVGVYIVKGDQIAKFHPFISKVVQAYHDPKQMNVGKSHRSDFDLLGEIERRRANKSNLTSAGKDLFEGNSLDLKNVHINAPMSCRIRVGRNVKGFNLPSGMSASERIKLERRLVTQFFSQKIKEAQDSLKEQGIVNPSDDTKDAFCKYYSFSTMKDIKKFEEKNKGENLDHDEWNNLASEGIIELLDIKGADKEKYELMEHDRHYFFKAMDDDENLVYANIASDWPLGRGVFVFKNFDELFISWLNEEDHLRVMYMNSKGTNYSDCFKKFFLEFLPSFNKNDIDFMVDENYGFVTSCPSNFGTGMRASIMMPVPNLLKKHGTAKALKARYKYLNCDVRGSHGETSTADVSGLCDFSNSARLYKSEAELVCDLFKALEIIQSEELKEN